MGIDRKYRIAFVGGTEHPIPAVKGGAIQTLVTALIQENEVFNNFLFDVYTCSDKQLKDITFKNTRIIEINHKRFVDKVFFSLYKIARKLLNNHLPYKTAFMSHVNHILLKNQYDAIIYETSDSEFIQVKKTHNETVYFHIHSDYLSKDSYKINSIINNCDYFIAVSEFIKKQLLKITKNDNKILVLQNGIDVESYINDDYSIYRKEVRKKLGIIESDIVVIYCSRLSPEKGCLELLKAVEKLPNCKLLIVGGENFDSNVKTSYVKKLRSFSNSFNERVIFTGYVDHSTVKQYMYASDIGVVPSVCNEASSLTLLEFRACGLPTIATRMGGIVENCNDTTTIKVELNDSFVDNLRNAIDLLCNNRQLLCSMKKEASVGIEKYNYENYYKNFCRMLDSSIGDLLNGNPNK